MVQYLINTARSLIFSTAPGPPAVAGALAALELLIERPHRVERLRSNARALRRGLAEEGFPVAESEMHIVPLVIGEERSTLALCQRAIEGGVFAQAIRPPTVPDGTSRLRLTAMASHTPAELRLAARTLAEAARRVGIDPAEILAPSPEPLHEIEEIETALVRAERLAAPAGASGPMPFDFERDSGGSPRAEPPAAGVGAPLDAGASVRARAAVESSAELFDAERKTVRAA
jgi:glycine C-acetyltransferase/8-amino-7-oxononanoate synthase